MNYKILILIALIASVLLSGCLSVGNNQPHEYKIMSLKNQEGHLYISYTVDNDTMVFMINKDIKTDWELFQSNETKLIDNPEPKFGQSNLILYWDGKEIN